MSEGEMGRQVLSNRQRKLQTKRIKAEQAALPKPEPVAPEERFRTTAKVDGDTVVAREGGYDQQLSRLEYLLSKGVITARQCDAGAWLADKWQAYFAPASSSGIDDHAPGSIPSDPLARWARGQRTTDWQGRARTPPPTFRPRRPSETRYGHDGWSRNRCDALQDWVRAQRLISRLSAYDREVVVLVAIEGRSLEEVVVYITGAKAAGGKQRSQVKGALHRGLDAIADETEPMLREIAA